MKQVVLWLMLAMIVCGGVSVPDTLAGGVGFFLNSGRGNAEYEVDNDTGPDFDVDADTGRRGLGLVVDSTVAKDRIFNYRLNVGPYYWQEEFDGGREFELDGFMMSHDFGFGVLRNKYVRLWLGPEIRFAYGRGNDETNDDFDVGIFSFGVGPVLGVNVHLGPVVSLGIKSGYLFESFVGWGEDDLTDNSEDYYGDSTQFFVTFNVIFRIKDVF